MAKAQAKQETISDAIVKACVDRWKQQLDAANKALEWPINTQQGTRDALQMQMDILRRQVRSIYAYPFGGRASAAANKANVEFNNVVGPLYHSLLKRMALKQSDLECAEAEESVRVRLKDPDRARWSRNHDGTDLTVNAVLHEARRQLDTSTSLIIAGEMSIPLQGETLVQRVNELRLMILKEANDNADG